MSNRRRLRDRQRTPQRRCPRCRSRSFRIRSYPDAILYICRGCLFPIREVKDEAGDRTPGAATGR